MHQDQGVSDVRCRELDPFYPPSLCRIWKGRPYMSDIQYFFSEKMTLDGVCLQ